MVSRQTITGLYSLIIDCTIFLFFRPFGPLNFEEITLSWGKIHLLLVFPLNQLNVVQANGISPRDFDIEHLKETKYFSLSQAHYFRLLKTSISHVLLKK